MPANPNPVDLAPTIRCRFFNSAPALRIEIIVSFETCLSTLSNCFERAELILLHAASLSDFNSVSLSTLNVVVNASVLNRIDFDPSNVGIMSRGVLIKSCKFRRRIDRRT